MPWGGRGRVIKAGTISGESSSVSWQAPAEKTPAAEIEVIREAGQVVEIVVKCRCGQVHDLEFFNEVTEPVSSLKKGES